MKSKSLLIILLVLGIALTIFLFSSYKLEQVTDEPILNSQIAKDEFTMAQRLLLAHGVKWEKSDLLVSSEEIELLELDSKSVVLIDEAALIGLEYAPISLYSWVEEEGGHVIYQLNRFRENLDLYNVQFPYDFNIEVEPIDFVEVTHSLVDKATANTYLPLDDTTRLELQLTSFFDIKNCEGLAVHDDYGHTVICQVSVGDGYVTILSSLDQFNNYQLRNLDHGSLLLWLTDGANRVVYMPYINYSHWLTKLWHWNWQLVISIPILLIFLVWHLSSRFGRAYEPSLHSQVSFIQHIQALANFYIKHGHEDYLLTSLKKDFNNKIEARIPNFKRLSFDKQIEIIAQLTHVDAQTIGKLLVAEFPDTPAQRTEYIKQYRRLRNAL